MTDRQLLDAIHRDTMLRGRVERIVRAAGDPEWLAPGGHAARAFDLLAGRDTEAFVVGVVGADDRELACSILAESDAATFVTIDARTVFRYALRHHGAAGLWIAHNHPSGNPEHSDADRMFAQLIAHGCTLIGLRFLGSWIVTDAGQSSIILSRSQG